MQLSIAFLALGPASLLAQGDGSFQAPLELLPASQKPSLVATADFNRDGRADLATTDDADLVLIHLQDPADRRRWTQVIFPLEAGSPAALLSADFDADGCDDLALAAGSAGVRLLRCRGDGTFAEWTELPEAPGVSALASGDFNGDRQADLAVAARGLEQILVYLNEGRGQFSRPGNPLSPAAARLEAADWSGDRILDLVAKTDQGVRPGVYVQQGRGDGSFDPRGGPVANLGCLSDFALGDLNHDGRADLAGLCNTPPNRSFVAGLSVGDGTWQKTFELEVPVARGPMVVADLDGDGAQDAAFAQASRLQVLRGKGDGLFHPAVVFEAIRAPSLARDLDGDARPDLVSLADGLSIVWGRAGRPFLEAPFTIPELPGAKSLALADLDRNGSPEFLIPEAEGPGIRVYRFGQPQPASVIDTAVEYESLEAVDLDDDGIPDLLGVNPSLEAAVVALVDQAGNIRRESVHFADFTGVGPRMVAAGKIDEGVVADLAVPCLDGIALFLGLGGGDFGSRRLLETIWSPTRVVLRDLDRDTRTDLVVMSENAVATHWGRGGGHFAPAEVVAQNGNGNGIVAIGVEDLNGDRFPDLAILEYSPPPNQIRQVQILHGNGEGFTPGEPLLLPEIPDSLALTDLDGNGLPDITVAQHSSFSVFLNLGTRGFDYRVDYPTGFQASGHRFADLDLDGAQDLVAFGPSAVVVLLGRPSRGTAAAGRFRRGDVDGNGSLELTDPIRVLDRLFLGGEALSCEDAADADDTGTLELADPIFVISRLFLGGPPPAPPGPETCGPDPTADNLAPCAAAGC